MPILASDIQYFESTNGLGGEKTETPVPDGALNGLFDAVNSSGAAHGETNYRCIYLYNAHPTITLQDASIYLSLNTPSSSTVLGIGIGTSVIGGIEQTIPTEDSAPIGVFFDNAINVSQGIGSIPARSWKALWLRRVVTAGAGASASDGATLVAQGDTTS